MTLQRSLRLIFYSLTLELLVSSGTPRSVAAEPVGSDKPGMIFRDRVDPHWFANNDKLWYRVRDREHGIEFVLVDAVNGARSPAFDHERLSASFGAQLEKKLKPGEWPFESIKFANDGKSIQLIGSKQSWQCDLQSYQLAAVTNAEAGVKEEAAPRTRERRRPAADPTARLGRSPDEKWETVVHDHNLYLRNVQTKEERALSHDGSAGDSYARSVQWDRAIEMEYNKPDVDSDAPEVFWAPDSKTFVAMRIRPGAERKVFLVESSPKYQLQPKLQSYPYLKPGDDIPVRKPHLFEVEGGREIPLSDSLFATPWSISELRWSQDSSSFSFLYNQRGHQVMRIVGVNAKTGEARAMVEEQSKTFIDYAGKSFSEYLDARGEIIWMSERDGWNHLYLYDAKSGKVKNQITRGEWVVRGVDHVDKEKGQVWFRAGDIRPGQDPYFIHYCRANFDGTGLLVLTEGDGTHSAQFSPDRRFFVDTWSRVDLPPISELRRSEDGKLVCKLEEADVTSLAGKGWKPPERFVAKGRDGSTDIYGVIHRPKNFDPNKKYPIIESIYAGPHNSFVPKSFRASYGQDSLASNGFVVVQIDGMGTSNRSKKFHDVCWKNLGDAGFPDRILWMKAAAAKNPALDITRVGIYGGSAGGQNALRALLAYGDFYKAAASDCGCHDNRMDKIWWNELWMGWPVGPHYDEQSNVTQAHKLKGKLLLTFGELDKNVDPSSTMQVVNALIKANKDFELIVFPGAGHGAGGSPYGERRRTEFFVRNLLGTESLSPRPLLAAPSPSTGKTGPLHD